MSSYRSASVVIPFVKRESKIEKIRKLIKQGLIALNKGDVKVASTDYREMQKIYETMYKPDREIVLGEILDYYNKLKLYLETHPNAYLRYFGY